MELGKIKNVNLYPNTETTLLISELSNHNDGANSFCLDLSSYMTHRDNTTCSKSFRISIYLTHYIPNTTKYNQAYITFTHLKRYYTRCFWNTTDNINEAFLSEIRNIVLSHLDLPIGESIDCVFEIPFQLNAQGNWVHRYWGETSLYSLPGIKLERVM